MLVLGKGNMENKVVRFPGKLMAVPDRWAPSDISCKRGCEFHPYKKESPACVSSAYAFGRSYDFAAASNEVVKAAHCPRMGYPNRTKSIIEEAIIEMFIYSDMLKKEGNFQAASQGLYETANLISLIRGEASWRMYREAAKCAFLAKDYKSWFAHSITAAKRASGLDPQSTVEIYCKLGAKGIILKLFAFSAAAYSFAALYLDAADPKQAGIFRALSEDANKQARLAIKSVKKSSIVFPKSE